MEKNITPLWLDNAPPPRIKRLFKFINIGHCLWGGMTFFLLGVIFSWYFFVGGIMALLLIAIATYAGSLRYPIKIGPSSEGLYYITKRGKKGFILWDMVESVRPIIWTKKELCHLFYKERKTINILAINKNVLNTIKPYLRGVEIRE